jgi:hypothetical protein
MCLVPVVSKIFFLNLAICAIKSSGKSFLQLIKKCNIFFAVIFENLYDCLKLVLFRFFLGLMVHGVLEISFVKLVSYW